MCGGVKYHHNGKEYIVYFPQPGAALPVRRKDGTTDLVTWGRREGEEGKLPQTGWARLDSIKAGKWDYWFPKPALIIVDAFMEKDTAGNACWYPLGERVFIQGLLSREHDELRIYVVTTTPNDPEQAAIHDRWPRLVVSSPTVVARYTL